MSWLPLFTTAGGTQYWFKDNQDGTYEVTSFQEVDPFLDHNHRLLTENDGWSKSKELRRIGSIPLNLIRKWKEEEGFDALNPQHDDKLRQRFNDIDYQKLRTAHWRL